LADRHRRLRRLTPACLPHKLYIRTYAVRRPLFPARLAARAPRWLRQALAPPAPPPMNHRHREPCHSARHAAGNCYCSAACGDVLAAATPSATDARAKDRTLSQSRSGIHFQTWGKETRQWSESFLSYDSATAKRPGQGRRQE
jgi:hypothetical protein